MRFLFKLYLISLAFFTFANFRGFIPLSSFIIISIFSIFIFKVLIKKKIYLKIFDLPDKFLIGFIFLSITGFIFSLNNDLNLNHLFSHFFVFGFFYFFVKIYLFNTLNANFIFNISNYISIIFYTIVITTLVDFIFFGFGINLANFLPLETRNINFGESWGARAYGFFVEPTDLALALNIYGPLYIGFNYFFNKKNQALIGGFFYIVLLGLTRSSAGFFEIFTSLVIVFFYKFFSTRTFKISISFKLLKQIFFLLFLLIIVYAVFKDNLDLAFSELIRKFDFVNSNFETGDIRVIFWVEALQFIKSFDILELLFGVGTGFTSYNLKTFSWYFTLFIENGLIGLIFILIFFIGKMVKCFKLNNDLKFFYLTAIISIFLQLFSQVGYFYPYVWFPIATLDLLSSRFANNKI
jgi:hypothetical protein